MGDPAEFHWIASQPAHDSGGSRARNGSTGRHFSILKQGYVLSRSPIAHIGQSVSVIAGRGANGRASTLACK